VSTLAASRTLGQAAPAASVSVVIPCLNEAGNIAECVQRAQHVLAEHAIEGEVIVVDNGSDDGSAEIARFAGARVIDEPRRGYGSAYRSGFRLAVGDYIVMIDADLTYDFAEIPRFVHELDLGAEFVMGNRLESVQP
jgi:glycosyltransferase involved in cell wall biosynthesis